MPVSFEVDCLHRRTNVPVYAPLYVPFQLPDSAGPATRSDDLVGLVSAATLDWRADVTLAREVDNGAGVDDVEDVASLDEHAATSAAAVPTTKISFVRFMSSPRGREVGCRRQ